MYNDSMVNQIINKNLNMKIIFHNPNYSTTTISGKTLHKIISTYIHKYNRHISTKQTPQFILTHSNFNIPYTIIKH